MEVGEEGRRQEAPANVAWCSGQPPSDGWEPGVAAAWGPRSCPALGEPAVSLIWLDGPILVLTIGSVTSHSSIRKIRAL